MLPLSIQFPAAVVLIAGGAIACFAGYRLFRLVLGVYGFILGALVASSSVGAGDSWTAILAALAGGVGGAVILLAGYLVGVALVGAGVGALLVTLAWRPFGGEPHWSALLAAAAVGGIAALAFQRYVIIVATAFGGAWTMLVGASALLAGRSARAASSVNDVWVVYPSSAGQPGLWVYVAWVVLALVGLYVQLHTSGKAGKDSRKKGLDARSGRRRGARRPAALCVAPGEPDGRAGDRQPARRAARHRHRVFLRRGR